MLYPEVDMVVGLRAVLATGDEKAGRLRVEGPGEPQSVCKITKLLTLEKGNTNNGIKTTEMGEIKWK